MMSKLSIQKLTRMVLKLY